MAGLERDTIGGFNAMLSKQRALPGECVITTVLFDHHYDLLHDRIDIRAVRPISQREYRVGGSTALTVYTVPEEAEAADPAQLTYTSSNESVAAVSEDGTVTAKGAGSAVITVTYQGSMTAEYSLTVRAKQTARPGTSTGSTAGTGGTGSAGATAPSGGGTAPAPSPTPDPAPTEPQHYHGNGSDAGVCPVCGVHYSPDVALDPDAPVNELPDLS